MTKRPVKKRARRKEAMAIIKAVEAAGGSVTLTAKGHLRVTGPLGLAIVASDPANNSMRQSIETIRKYAGLTIVV